MRTKPESVATELIAGMHGGLRLMAGMDAPVIAAVHGTVMGGGLRLGIVTRVVPAGQLATETQSLAERLASGPTQALGHMKRLLRNSLQNSLDAHLDAEAGGFLACTATADFREGVEAFLDKRTTNFTGA
ncbi:MAG: enoyl-CoA hydratase-related protein [Burkholderiaceae bacterium]